MGKASSSKKVARAAGTGGGRTARGRTPWVWYSALALVCVLGTAGVVTSRDNRLHKISAGGQTAPRANKDHWHVAYGVYVCDSSPQGGHFLAPITDQRDPQGIHTHGDGIIHTHPYVAASAGTNATLGVFASATKMTLNAGELKVPGGHDYRDGDSCNGKPGRVQVQIFNNRSDTTGHLATVDPRKVRLYEGELLTIAFAPKGAKLPAPPSASNLNKLTDVAPTTTTTTTPAGTTPATTTPAGTTPATTAPAVTPPAPTTAPATTVAK